MDFKTYQNHAEKTIQKYIADEKINEFIPFLGIIGEAGSVLTELKKKLRDGEGYAAFKDKLKEELGDVLWYISTIATQNKIDLEEVAAINIKKIEDRFIDLQKATRISLSPTTTNFQKLNSFQGSLKFNFIPS